MKQGSRNMGKYEEKTKHIRWGSFGRKTVAFQVGKSILPVGILPFEPLPKLQNNFPMISLRGSEAEKYLMNIVGTAIQAGDGKLITCGHVVEALIEHKSKGYILSRVYRPGALMGIPYPIQEALKYVDPRTNQVNKDVDLAVLICAAKSTKEIPYEIPIVQFGDSTKLGVGDQVLVGGYPYGKEMFLFTRANRGTVQPTFYSGIISAILPATNAQETRIIQISVPSAGGMSGGAVFDPRTGRVVGMVTSCVYSNGIPLPMAYALPSEIIAPFVEVITFRRN